MIRRLNQKYYNVLNSLDDDQAQYSVCNSSLSEYAVLGMILIFIRGTFKYVVISILGTLILSPPKIFKLLFSSVVFTCHNAAEPFLLRIKTRTGLKFVKQFIFS